MDSVRVRRVMVLEWIVSCQEGHGVGVDVVRVMVLEWMV